MTFLTSLKEWIDSTKAGTSLAEIPCYPPGGIDSIYPPFIALTEDSAAVVEAAGVVMHGVYTYEISCDLVTVPGETGQAATAAAEYEQQRADLHDILANRGMIDWASGRNTWRIFDIRASGPTMIPEDGLRVVRVNLTVIACPINSTL